MTTERADHWDAVYRAKPSTEVGWFQNEPAMSLRLLSQAPPPRSVIDVGGGASLLADGLLARGFADVTVLDVSDQALRLVRERLARDSEPVSFVVADILNWRPERQWNAWHDRAVFHFLIDPNDRARYAATAAHAVASGGVLVIGCFALDGPESCSGLPTVRYDAEGLASEFAPAFRLEQSHRELHRTPGGGIQPFTWVVLRRS